MLKLKKPILAKDGLDPYLFIDEYILVPWLYEKDPPDILWTLCSKLPFQKKIFNILNQPDVIDSIVDDNDSIVNNSFSEIVNNGEEDWGGYTLLTAADVKHFEYIKHDYCERPEWNITKNYMQKLLMPLSGNICTGKIRPRKIGTKPKGKQKYELKYKNYAEAISFLVRDYRAILEIKERLNSTITNADKSLYGKEKLSNYFGKWKKTGPRKNLLLTKLIAGLEYVRDRYNPAGSANRLRCQYKHLCRLRTCEEHPRHVTQYRLYEQSAKEIPYILSKLDIFPRIKCKNKESDIKCLAVPCLEDRVAKCDSYDPDPSLKNYCADYCRRSLVGCPLKDPCPAGRVKYKNECKKIKHIPPITEL